MSPSRRHAEHPGRRAGSRFSIALALATLAVAGPAAAQTPSDWGCQVGLRTTFMLSAMSLSELGDGFADLPAGGEALPHASSIFILWPLGSHARLGIETLVGNSYPESGTQILFQGSGVTAEYQTSGTWFTAAGVQVGGMIVSATQTSEPADDDGEPDPGVHYKESGAFLAPQVALGRRVRRFDVRLVGKQVWQLGSKGLGAFDGFYAGVSVARLFG